MPVIGLLYQRSPDELADRLRGFRQGLRDSGLVEGHNVAIDYRWAENKIDRLPELAADLARRQVVLIAATGGISPALAAKAATTAVPIVFIVSADPVALGLVASLARPGGNLTGINFLNSELTAKRLELLHELAPKVTILGFACAVTVGITASAIKLLTSTTRAVAVAPSGATGIGNTGDGVSSRSRLRR